MARGADQLAPRFVDSVKNTCGLASGPLTYAITIRFVASAPVGAPLAMSTLGAGARSLRAPATPSMTGRPWTGSNAPGCWTGPATGCGLDQPDPPSVDFDMNSNGCLPPCTRVPTPNTYAVPSLAVRIVHPSSGLRWPLLAAGVIWCWLHVSPPSWETATISGAGAALPVSWPRNDAQHTYTVPKKGLEDALSAQICSLSENVVVDCLLITTGCIHAFLAPDAAACGSSVRDTAIASKPLNACSERTALTFAVRL